MQCEGESKIVTLSRSHHSIGLGDDFKQLSEYRGKVTNTLVIISRRMRTTRCQSYLEAFFFRLFAIYDPFNHLL